ncbi:hypothetical protein PR202_ga25600 [Eleusine coracana subsp. coracana]|uniref:Amine oxidase domain-containing protein n=1 Tax=Eleusine coracana subsp. coracana TaxID=191504 RepID=A0AAV5DB57_ELECO|nr:hypothetical protein PR202_ga25600 [Eleusine coracana subsp. coracana]
MFWSAPCDNRDQSREDDCGEEGVRKQEGLRREETMRVAVVGAGLSGLAAAHELARSGCADVTLYEKENCLGGQAKTVAVDDGCTGNIDLDLGLMVFNRLS